MKKFIIYICLLSFVLIAASSNKNAEKVSLSISYYGLEENQEISRLPCSIYVHNKNNIVFKSDTIENKIENIIKESPLSCLKTNQKYEIFEQSETEFVEKFDKSTMPFYRKFDHVILIKNYLLNPKKHNTDFLNKTVFLTDKMCQLSNKTDKTEQELKTKEIINWDNKGNVKELTLSNGQAAIPINVIFLKSHIKEDVIKPLILEHITKEKNNFLENLKVVNDLSEWRKLDKEIEEELVVISLSLPESEISKKLLPKNEINKNNNKNPWLFYCFLAALGVTGCGLIKTGIIEVKLNFR